MAFKITNFSKQMGGSPFHNDGFDPGGSYADKKVGYVYFNAVNKKLGELSNQKNENGQYLSDYEIQNHPELLAIKENKNNIIMSAYNAQQQNTDGSGGGWTPSGPYADSWNNNFKTENGQRVGKYDTYSDNEEGFANYVREAEEWNAEQKNKNPEVVVLDTDNVNVEEEVEPIEEVVDPSAHVPSEGIQIISGKQRRAAKRVARLRNKAAKKGGLTESQSKRLNRSIDKAQGNEVAFADRTKVGQVISKAGDTLGITPDEEEVV